MFNERELLFIHWCAHYQDEEAILREIRESPLFYCNFKGKGMIPLFREEVYKEEIQKVKKALSLG
jgi:hypothetical protein